MGNETYTKSDKLFNCIKSIEAGSSKISTWTLSIVGGSLLAILSDSYIHPTESKLRAIYTLFIVGWALLGMALFYGKEILGSTIASELCRNNEDQLIPIFEKCNTAFEKQLRCFNMGLLIFGIWLFIYLIWWIFCEIK